MFSNWKGISVACNLLRYLSKKTYISRKLVPRVSLCLCLLNDNGDPGNEVDISRTCTCIYLTLKVPYSQPQLSQKGNKNINAYYPDELSRF